MNDRQESMKRNDTARLVRMSNRNRRNGVFFSKNELLAHKLAKCLVSIYLNSMDKEFITEAIFENKKRADILILDDSVAVEIVCSEKEESIVRKRKDYPVDIIVLKATDVIVEFNKGIIKLMAFLDYKLN